MKSTLLRLRVTVILSLSFLLGPNPALSQNFYFGADAGVALAEDVDLRHFVVSTRGSKLKLNAGPRLTLAGGYHLNDYVGFQLESGLISNEIKGSDGDMAISHVPILADVVLRYDKPDCSWIPYAGAGAGGAASIVFLDHVRAPDGTVVDGSGSTMVFAWQAFAGLRYTLNSTMSLGGGYKFFSAEGASWDVERGAGDIETGTAHVHSLVVDFTMKF